MRNCKTKSFCRILVIIVTLMPIALSMKAQDKIVAEGIVLDELSESLIGAAVTLKGNSSIGTITDINGSFRLEIPLGETLIVSYLGYTPREVVVKNTRRMSISLTPDNVQLKEVVVVGYGSQKRNSVTGAISSVRTDEIMKSPTGNLSTSVVGRVPGLLAKQDNGRPGDDDATLRIRGISTYAGDQSPLILVDGVERSFNQIDPEEVESFTVLKDAASTAVYGIRGANGVILVTTKRGKAGKTQVSYTGNVALQTSTRLPKTVDSYTYANAYNQAIKNDNPAAEDYYRPDELQKYRDGSDPIFYPNSDWLDLALNKVAIQHKHNVNISGGTDIARYYISLGYFNQEGLQKNISDAYGYKNKDAYRRINLRSNIDLTVTPTTQLSLTLGLSNGHKTRVPDDRLFWTSFTTPPNASPGMVNGKLVYLGGKVTDRNPLQEMTKGISDIYSNHVDVNIELRQNLNFITQGLTFKGKISYDDDYTQKNERTKNEQVFYAMRKMIDGVEKIVYQPKGEVGQLGGSGNVFSGRRKKIYGEVSLNYKRAFNKDHHVSALLLMNLQKRKYDTGGGYDDVATGYIEYVGRVAYDFKEKYLAEFNIGINGSENFAPDKRYGYFPAVSVGWVATNEEFIKKLIPSSILSYLKIRASYGQGGNDKYGGRRFFYYPQVYNLNGSAFQFGESPQSFPGATQGVQSNANATWETSTKQNYAIETRFLKDRLFINFDYFIEKREDILSTLQTMPAFTGLGSASYNIGKTENKGFEIEAGWSQQINKFSYYVKGNYSFARNKILYQDEALDKDNPNLWKTGRRIGEQFGYSFQGFFQSEEEIANWPSQFGVKLSPGDVKYLDVNGDGVVDTNDLVPIRNPGFPEINYGISAGFSYKGFDVSCLFQGAANTSLVLGGSFQKPFTQLGTILQHSLDSWSPENRNAKYPRLSANHSMAQNYYNSSLWVKDASYLRLKNMEVGYTFPSSLLSCLKAISSLRVYVSTQNLCVWDKMDGITDPENKATTEGINYPQQKVFNFGVNVKF